MLSLCEWGWPRAYYPNWLGEKDAHPAVMFVSASLLWRLDSVPAGSIVTGGPPAQPLLFDPSDGMSHPDAACWHAYAKHFVGVLRAAIEDGDLVDIAWLERTALEALRVGVHQREARLDAGQETPFWYVRIFPGVTTNDRDEIMSGIMEAAAYQFGDHPLRTPAKALAAKGMSQVSIAKRLGVDRATVRRLLKSQ